MGKFLFCIHLLAGLLLLLPACFGLKSVGISFEAMLEKAGSPEFRLLQLLAHPDHSILPNQDSFNNKTALILAVGDFAGTNDANANHDLHGRLVEKWSDRGGQTAEMENLLTAVEGVGAAIPKSEDGIDDGIRLTLMTLYALGSHLLDDVLETKEELEGDDEMFVIGLQEAFTNVERALAGLDLTQPMTVNNAELLDRVAGFGSSLTQKYGSKEVEMPSPMRFKEMLEGGADATKTLALLLAQEVDILLTEGASKDGGSGYVKTDDDDNDEEGDDLEIKPLDGTSEQVEEKAEKIEDAVNSNEKHVENNQPVGNDEEKKAASDEKAAVTSNEKEIQHDEPAANEEEKKAASIEKTEEKQKDETDKIPQVESVPGSGSKEVVKEGSMND